MKIVKLSQCFILAAISSVFAGRVSRSYVIRDSIVSRYTWQWCR